MIETQPTTNSNNFITNLISGNGIDFNNLSQVSISVIYILMVIGLFGTMIISLLLGKISKRLITLGNNK